MYMLAFFYIKYHPPNMLLSLLIIKFAAKGFNISLYLVLSFFSGYGKSICDINFPLLLNYFIYTIFS